MIFVILLALLLFLYQLTQINKNFVPYSPGLAT